VDAADALLKIDSARICGLVSFASGPEIDADRCWELVHRALRARDHRLSEALAKAMASPPPRSGSRRSYPARMDEEPRAHPKGSRAGWGACST